MNQSPEQLELLTAAQFFERYTVTDLEPGKLYLRMFHGRTYPDEQLEGWGSEGPVLGPLTYAHLTYLSSICLQFGDGEEYLCLSPDDPLHLAVEGLLYGDGVYYGDFTLFIHQPKEDVTS
jgi:hypothetical protein